MSIGAGHMQANTFDIKEYTHKHGLPNLVWHGAELFPTPMSHYAECFHPDDITELHEYYTELRDHAEFDREVTGAEDCFGGYWLAVKPLLREHRWLSMSERPEIKERIRRIIEQERLAAGVQWSQDELRAFVRELRGIYEQ